MTAKYGPLGMQADDRYRSIPESRIVEMLVLIGWSYEAGTSGATESCRASLQSWTEMGLGFRRGPGGEHLFDPVEVNNFQKRAGLDDRDNFWSERAVRTIRRLVSDLAEAGSSSLAPRSELPFVVDFKRVFNLRSVAPGSRLRLRAPLPLEGNYLRNLQVTPFAEGVHDTQVDIRPGRMEIRITSSGENEAALGAKISFTARPQEPIHGQVDEEPDPALYLNHREGLIVVTQRLLALAESLAGKGASSRDAVRAFWEYINEKLIPGSVHYDQVDFTAPCDWVLDAGWHDCQLCAALFVALCRARGIPARVIGGCQLYPRVPAKHYWAEAWIEDQGWMPFDMLSWDLAMGGRDPDWRDYFFGRLDHRMITERLPREFTGALGIPIPPAWFILHVLTPTGTEVSFLDLNNTPVYIDTVRATV
jgi:hypothetical protein